MHGMMIKPEFLKKGGIAALIAPAGHQPAETLEAAAACIERYGIIPKIYPSCRMQHGYLSGTDEARAKDVTDAFSDPDVSAVICLRGGYGCHRLFEYIDWETVSRFPKFLYGYSDITALHSEISRRCGFMSWHSPMPGTEWTAGMDAFTERSLLSALFGPFPDVIANPSAAPLNIIADGETEGQLTGGNLTLLTASLGTSYEFDAEDKIIFIEDVHETPRNIDRMLLHLRHCGKFEDCRGVILGTFSECEALPGTPTLTLEEIFTELLSDIGKPVISNLQCGHSMPSMSLPLGAAVRISTKEKEIRVIS